MLIKYLIVWWYMKSLFEILCDKYNLGIGKGCEVCRVYVFIGGIRGLKVYL